MNTKQLTMQWFENFCVGGFGGPVPFHLWALTILRTAPRPHSLHIAKFKREDASSYGISPV
jgi:hypothetical protein